MENKITVSYDDRGNVINTYKGVKFYEFYEGNFREEGGKGLKTHYMLGNQRFDSLERLMIVIERAVEESENINNNNLKITTMKNPKILETIIEAATYKVPTYKITNNGVEDGDGAIIMFCKGNKEDDTIHRQEGVFSETLIQAVKQYLESVNVGAMATRETSMVITKLDEALMWIDKRANDRKLRDVQGTYKP